jgi:hypothetical protein
MEENTMAKASVKIVCEDCGKVFTWERKCFNRKQADETEEWAKDHVTQCPSCYGKMMSAIARKKAEKESKAFAPLLEKYNLPLLTGTEKQVAWADTIRNNAIGKLLELEPTDSFMEWLRTKNTAKWWIENRDDVGYPLVLAEMCSRETKTK